MSPLLCNLPFDLALWATMSLSPSSRNRWGIMMRVIPVDNLVVSPDPEGILSASDRPIFLDISSNSERSTHNAGDGIAIKAPRVGRDHSATVEAGSGGVQQYEDTMTRPDVGNAGEAQQKHEQQEQERVEEGEDSWEVLSQELADPGPLPTSNGDPFTSDLARGNLCVFVPGYLDQRLFAEVTVESVLRLMPGVRVAVAVDPSEMGAYQRSIGSLPSVAVTRSIDVKYSAVTADLRCGDDTELVLYLEPGALLSRPFTKEDTHDPVTGDLLVVSTNAARAGPRHATFADSAGEILGARNLPAFVAGADLILPVSANRDVRDALALGESKSADWRIHSHAIDHDCFESEVHVTQILASMAFIRRRPGVKFVQITPANGDKDGVGTRFDGDDSIETEAAQPLVFRPRFGCQIYSEVYYTDDRSMPLVLGKDDLLFLDDGERSAAQALRALLGRFFRGEEACTSGLALLPWSALVKPDGFPASGRGDGSGINAGGDGSESESRGGEWMNVGFYSSSSTLPSNDVGLSNDRLGCSKTDPCPMYQSSSSAAAPTAATAGAAIWSDEGGHHLLSSAAHREYNYNDELLNMGTDEVGDGDSISYSAANSRPGAAGHVAAVDRKPASSVQSAFELELNDNGNDFLPDDAGERIPFRFIQQGGSSQAAAAAATALSGTDRADTEQYHNPAPSTSTFTTQWVYDNEYPNFAADQEYGLTAHSSVSLSSRGVYGWPVDSIESNLERVVDDDFPFVRASELAPVGLVQLEEAAEGDIAAATATSSTAAAPAADADAAPGAAVATVAAAASTTGSPAVSHGEKLGILGGLGYLDSPKTSTDGSHEDDAALFRVGSHWSDLFRYALRRARAALS